MDLSTLKFKVDTTELADAIVVVDNLGKSVENLAAPISSVASSSSKLGKAVGDAGKSIEKDLTKQTDEAATSLSKVEKMIEKAGLSLAVLRNQTIETSDGTYKVSDSFTKMQAGMLATAKQAGATTDQIEMLAKIIRETNVITGQNPFDKSASGLARLRKEVEEMNAVTALQAQGLALTGAELQEYSRDVARVTAAFQAENKSAEELSSALAKLKADTLALSREKAEYTQRAKEAELQVKREAAERLAAERAGMTMNDDAVKLFLKNEKEKQRELDRTNRMIERQAAINEKYLAQQRFISEGYSTSSSGKAAQMQMQGVPPAVIKSFLDQSKAAEQSAKASREAASANRFLADVQNRLNEQLREGNRLGTEYTDQLARIKTALSQSGMSAAAAAKQYAVLESQIAKVASKDRQRQLDNLARGVSVQMGDVGISLAGGMNPFLVMIQQGDQIRGLLQQTGADAVELKRTMNSAAAQIASSIALTAKAIGGFFVGSIVSAGKAVSSLTEKIPLLGFFPKAFSEMGKEAELAGKNGSTAMATFATGLKVVGTTAAFVSGLLAALPVVALISAVIAVINIIRESDKLTRTLVLTNGALGITKDQADQVALSMRGLGVNTTTTMQVMTAMAGAGNLTSESIELVTVSAENLKRYGKVAIEDTVKVFSDLAKDPLDALFKVHKQTGMVTQANLELVESLILQGKEQEAATVAMRIYADVTAEQVEQLKANYTDFANFMIKLGGYIKGFYNTIKDTIRGLWIEPSESEQMTKLAKQLVETQIALNENNYPQNRAALERHKKDLQDQLSLLNATYLAEKQQAEQTRTNAALQEEASKLRLKNLSAEEKLRKEVAALSLKMEAPGISQSDRDTFNKERLRLIKEHNEAMEKAAESKKKVTGTQREQNKQESDYESLLKRINTQINASTAVVQDLNKAEKLRLDILDDPRFKNLPAKYKAELEAILQKAIVAENAAEEEKKRLKELSDIEKERERQEKTAAEQSVKSIREITEAKAELDLETESLNEAYQVEFDNILKSSDARKKAMEIYKIEIDYRKELLKLNEEFDKTDGGIDAVLALQAAIEAANRKKETRIKLIDKNETLDLFRDVMDTIEKGLGSSIDRVLRGDFRGALNALRSTIQEALSKPFKVIIQGFLDVVGGVVKEFAGSALKSVFGDVFSLSKLKEYGSTFAKAAMPYLKAAAPYAAVAAGMFAGNKIGQAVSGGYSTGGSGNSAVNSGTGVGTVVGAIFGGPIGAAIGSAIGGTIGGVINRLFGRKLVDSGVEGTFSGSGFSGNSFAFEKGGLFRSDRRTTGTLDSAVGDMLSKTFGSIQSVMLQYANTLNSGVDAVQSFTKTISVSTKGLSEEEVTKKFEEIFSATSDEMADLILGITKVVTESINVGGSSGIETLESSGLVRDNSVAARLIREGETSSQALERLVGALVFVNASFEALGFTLKELSVVGAESAQVFVDLFGGAEQMTAAIGSYYENFYSEEEKIAAATASLTKAFAELGLGMIPTGNTVEEAKAAYRKLVDDAMQAGNESLAVALIQLSSNFNSLLEATERVKPELEAVSETLRNLQRENSELNIELLRMQGNTSAAEAAFRALATEGMLELEISLWDTNQAIRKQIDVLSERKNLEEQLNELTLTTAELRELEIAKLDASNQSLMREIFTRRDAAEKQQKIAQEELSLRQKLNELTLTTAELRELEIAALDESNQAILRQIFTLQDAARIAEEEARRIDAVNNERLGLERRLLQLQGDIVALRNIELAALDESNRALLQQIFDLEDKQKLDQEIAEAARQEAEEQARIAREQAKEQADAVARIRKTWLDLTDSIYDEVKRIRGLTNTASPLSFAQAQEQFATATAQARAGDEDAARRLPELSRALLEMAGIQARSLVELRMIEAMTAASLEMTAAAIAQKYGFTIPAFANGGNYLGGPAIVGERGPEIINFDSPGFVSNASTTARMLDNSEMIQAIERLNSNIEGLRYEVRADVQHNAKTAKLLDRVIKDGETISVSFDTPQQVVV